MPDTHNCGLRMRRECRERFPRHRGLAIPTCITARAWRTYRDACRDCEVSGWRGKHSQHPRRMRNPQFYVSGKRPIGTHLNLWHNHIKKAQQNCAQMLWAIYAPLGGIETIVYYGNSFLWTKNAWDSTVYAGSLRIRNYHVVSPYGWGNDDDAYILTIIYFMECKFDTSVAK